ncbi:recombinase family protein [Streptomyces sp. F63]|uniref:recombinase family protein n=1 Tax=Streptomyces sp. F63 TaxID=2824887 RepID=UPI001B3893C1|nr:recombinase family protein [Streptomyces sp. F63]MBQ0984295.1 recombinase family protein [Streptomyces sp. F63]
MTRHLMLLNTVRPSIIISSMTIASRARVIGYVRISKATDESTSIERQREIITATCRARGWALAEIVEDADVSATKTRLDRPGLDRVRDAVRAGQVDVVMVWRIDRIARSVSDLASLTDEWANTGKGVSLVSATEPFDMTTSTGRMLLQLLGVFAEFEAATIRDRVRSARAAVVKAGRYPGGAAPYGYRVVDNRDGPGKMLEVDPVEAAYVRKAADMILGGSSTYAATAALNAAGSKPRKAAAWSLTSLRIVLTQDATLGYMTHHKKLVRDDNGFPVQVWEPLLPLEDVERLRALLKPTKTPGGERKRRTRLLSGGLLRCVTCGGSLRVNQTGGTKPTVRYGCFGKSDGNGCERGVSIVADRIEEHVEAEFLSTVGGLEVVEVRETVREVANLAAVESAIKAATAELADADEDEEDELMSHLRTLKARRRELAAQPSEPVVKLIPTGQTFQEAWDERDTDGRRALLGSALDHIVIRPGVRGRRGIDAGRVDIHWRNDHGRDAADPREAGRTPSND